jgi:tripartite-type tricarboxylate transporter receptor subunit TctC
MCLREQIILRCLVASMLAIVGTYSHAQNYPIKPIRVVIPFAPGGGTDVQTRTVGQKLSERWGQSVVVENRSGANGNIGAALVAKSAPDGYTLLATSGSFATNPAVYDSLPFDPIRSFDPVVMLAPTYYLLIVHPSLPVSNVQQLVALARKSTGKLTAAISGMGSPSHLAGELFRTTTKIDFVSVPYRGTGPALVDVLAGQADLMFCDMLSALPHVKARKVKALGISSAKRVSAVPDIAPIAESGVPGFEAISWSAIFVPAGTPRAIIAKLNGEIRAILRLPDVRERLATDGTAFGENTPEWMAAFIKHEIEKWTRVAHVSGTHVE